MEDVLIIVNIGHITDNLDQNIKNAKPGCDIQEIQETTDRVVKLLLDSLFLDLTKVSNTLKGECFQGVIDYLCYYGISDEHSFLIINEVDNQLMHIVFSTIPFIENEQLINLKDYKIFYRKDLAIHAKINKKHFGNSNEQFARSLGSSFNPTTAIAYV